MAQNKNIEVGLAISANVQGEAEIKQLIATLNQTTQSSDQLGKESQELSEKLALARAEAARLKQVWDADKGNDHARMAYLRQAKEVKNLEQSLQDLRTHGTKSHLSVAQAAETHGQKLNQIEQSLRQVKPSLADVAGAFGGLTTAGGGLAYVANEAIKFESAMAQVKKVTDATPAQIAELSGRLKDLGGQLGIMPHELAQIAAAGGQMGIAFEKLPAFTQMTAQMANAFGITAEAAGDMSAKISNVYGLTIDEMRELGDAMNALGNTTAAKEAEIGDALMRIGGNAKQFGLLKEEAAALSAAFISLGKPPEVAATAINALLTKMQTATEQGSDFKDGLRDVGLTAQEMADNIAANPQVALTDFLKRLEQLDKQSRSIVLTKMFGAEYSDDLALLAGSLKTYEDALSTATDKTKTFGAMQKEAAAALETTEGKMRQAKADIAAAAIDLGNALLPVVQATAVAVSGIANAVQAVSTRFPMLSQLAVLFVGAKVASIALGSAMKLAAVEGQASFLKTDVGVGKLKRSLLETATAAKTLGSSLQMANVHGVKYVSANTEAIKELGGKLAGAAQGAVAMWGALEMGMGIGSALYNQFDWVKTIGDNMAKPFAMLESWWETGSLEKYNKHFRTTAQIAKEIKQAEREAAVTANLRKEAQKQADAKQAEQIAQLTAQYRQYQKQLNATDTTLKQLENSGDTDIAMHQRMIEQKTKLEEQTAKLRAELGKFHANLDDTSPLAKNRQALQDLGLSVEQMSTGISEKASKSLDNFKLAAQGFGNDSKQMASIFQAALKDMDTPEAMTALKQALAETGAKAGLTAEQIHQITQAATPAVLNLEAISKELGAAQTAAETLGVDLTAALSGTSPAFQAALTNFSAIRSQLDGLAENGVNVGVVLQQAFAKLTENAQTKADIEALKAQIQSLGEAGKLSGAELENALLAADVKMTEIAQAIDPVAAAFRAMGVESRTATELQLRQAEAALRTIEQSGNATENALNQARNKVFELKNALDPTAQAFDRLGIKTKEALAQAMQQQMADFEKVRQSGQATQADLAKAFAQTAQAALASGDITQKAWVESQAATYQYKVAVDDSGNASLQAAAQTQQAADTQIQAHQQVTQAATESAQAQSQAAKAAVENVENVGKAAESSQHKMSDLGSKVHETLKKMGAYATFGTASWANTLRSVQDMYININQTVQRLNEETENGGNIAEHLARTELMAANNARKLDKTTLNNLHQAIDKARQKMQQLADEAANARKEAEKELLSAQGRDDEVARLEQQRKINELRKKQQAAQKTGNREASADYEAAITASQRAFEERKRREAEQRERERMEAAQRETSTALPMPDVRVETNVNHLADLISAQNHQVANQAVKQFEQQLRDAIAMQN